MNKLVFITLCITFSFIKTDPDPINWLKTEPYVTFDWLDKDIQSLTIVNSDSSTYKSCVLYNTSKVCLGKCKVTGKTITCDYEGKYCGGDSDNPTFKYYYSTHCSTSSLSDKYGNGTSSTFTSLGSLQDVGVTVAISNSHFIKYSMILLLSLLVL